MILLCIPGFIVIAAGLALLFHETDEELIKRGYMRENDEEAYGFTYDGGWR